MFGLRSVDSHEAGSPELYMRHTVLGSYLVARTMVLGKVMAFRYR